MALISCRIISAYSSPVYLRDSSSFAICILGERRLPSIREYFDKAFGYVITAARTVQVRATSGAQIDVIVQVHLDFDAPARYLSLFLPRNEQWFEACQYLLTQPYVLLKTEGDVNVKLPPPAFLYGGLYVHNGTRAEIRAKPLCEPEILDESLPFSGTIFSYSENEASALQIDSLKEFARQRRIRLRWRGPDFARERSLMEKPVAFISHDSRDKQEIARPIAIGLQRMVCPVWFDEFSLAVGDSLREKIEKGLKECARCILILSPNFLTNQGWTKAEFNSVFTREILENERVMLPVWSSVTAKDVYEYSPSLADRVGLDWGLGPDEVCRRLYNSIATATMVPSPSKRGKP
jgi:TIR domain-containing protein